MGTANYHLKSQLAELTGYIYFEFSIPRMGKRVDNIVILGDKIFARVLKLAANNMISMPLTK